MVLGTSDPDALRRLLPGPDTIVVKDDAHAAVCIDRAGRTAEPALRVDVVERVGAGDAFAAGYLAGTLRGYDRRRRLRLGHLLAAAALVVPGDHGAAVPAPAVEALLACPPDQWAATVITADGIRDGRPHAGHADQGRSTR